MAVFDLQPSLSGRLLNLRPLRNEDFEALYAVASDPLIWEQHPEKQRYQRPIFENFFTAALASKGALLATDLKSGEVIGTSRYNALSMNLRSVEIGYTFLARRCWGEGYNTEMKNLMLTHAFRFVDDVFFYIGEQNLRSRKAVEKLGAELLEKIERQPLEGEKYVATIYRLTRGRYLQDASERESAAF